MVSSIVVDSNVFLTTVIPDPLRQNAMNLIYHIERRNMQIIAPTLFRYELVAVLRKQSGRGVITSQQAETGLDIMTKHTQKMQFVIDDDLLKRAFEIAKQFNFPTAYDSQYLAVAEQFGCDFWTIDNRLVNVVSPTWSWVKWLGNFI